MAAHAVIAISPKAFIVVWWGIQLLHVLFVAYAVGVIAVHRYITAQNLQVIVNYLGPNAFGFFEPVIATSYLVIACHVAELLRTVLWSLLARELRFTRKSSSLNAAHPEAVSPTELHGPSTASVVEAVPIKTRHQRLQSIVSSLHARLQSYSITGPRYDSLFFLFEVTEISLQTFQACKLSGLVSVVWINRLYAFVLIFNCWSTAFVHRVVKRNLLVKRVLLLVVDSLFDAITNMVVPFAIFLPYVWEFDLELRDFPMDNYYHDVWLIQAISENQQVFVTSWLDFVAKVGPHFFVFVSIVTLKQIIVVDTVAKTKTPSTLHGDEANARDGSLRLKSRTRWPWLSPLVPTARTRFQVGNTLHRLSAATTGTIRGGLGFARRLSSSQLLAIRTELFATRTYSWHDLFFVIYGLTILAVHIQTTLVAVSAGATANGCMLEMRPWFAVRPTCATLEINCARGQHDHGRDADSLDAVFSSLERQSLKALVLSSCSHLRMPPAIHSLPALQMIKIYNSTIEVWDTSAELRDDRNPNLLFVFACDSNFSTTGELPIGMLSYNAPRQLVDIEFSGTNLVQLPTDLHEKWPFIMYFVLERSPGIVEFPEAVVTMNIPQLMLGSNSIVSVPDRLLENQTFWKLMLDGNPLKQLPRTIGDMQDLYKVGFAFTNVTELPNWMTINSSLLDDDDEPFLGFVDLYAGGTPLCGSPEMLASATAQLKPWAVVSCSLDVSTHAYPVEREREWRAASQATWF